MENVCQPLLCGWRVEWIVFPGMRRRLGLESPTWFCWGCDSAPVGWSFLICDMRGLRWKISGAFPAVTVYSVSRVQFVQWSPGGQWGKSAALLSGTKPWAQGVMSAHLALRWKQTWVAAVSVQRRFENWPSTRFRNRRLWPLLCVLVL